VPPSIPPPLAPELGRDLADQLAGNPLFGAGLLEEKQRGHSHVVDLSRFEHHMDFRGEKLQLVRSTLLQEQRREVERNQRGVQTVAKVQELTLNLPVPLLSSAQPAKTLSNVRFGPAQAQPIQGVCQNSERFSLFSAPYRV